MKPLLLGSHTFDWGSRTYMMGILNITPDSFSGDGLLSLIETDDPSQPMLDQAGTFLESNCDILDVGGESTRPGSKPVNSAAEKRRVIPVIKSLARAFPEALISIDTYKAEVADAALDAGAHIINDVWALRADPDLAAVAAGRNVPVVLMHNRSNPASVDVKERLGSAYTGSDYQNLLEEVKHELMDSVEIARRAGIPDGNIILDPGIGFGKTVEHNLELIRRLDEIRALGFPVLFGPSRKSFIGYTLDLPPTQRVEGTAAAVAVGITRGADIVRVHDVGSISRVVRMTDAIMRPKQV
jgi:dihydropteroate synthase